MTKRILVVEDQEDNRRIVRGRGKSTQSNHVVDAVLKSFAQGGLHVEGLLRFGNSWPFLGRWGISAPLSGRSVVVYRVVKIV